MTYEIINNNGVLVNYVSGSGILSIPNTVFYNENYNIIKINSNVFKNKT